MARLPTYSCFDSLFCTIVTHPLLLLGMYSAVPGMSAQKRPLQVSGSPGGECAEHCGSLWSVSSAPSCSWDHCIVSTEWLILLLFTLERLATLPNGGIGR